MRTKNKLLSVCSCGFPLLSENVPLGTEFEVFPHFSIPVILTCGGCKTEIPLTAIWVEARGDSAAGYMPGKIFDL